MTLRRILIMSTVVAAVFVPTWAQAQGLPDINEGVSLINRLEAERDRVCPTSPDNAKCRVVYGDVVDSMRSIVNLQRKLATAEHFSQSKAEEERLRDELKAAGLESKAKTDRLLEFIGRKKKAEL